jgi:hypothetical protein
MTRKQLSRKGNQGSKKRMSAADSESPYWIRDASELSAALSSGPQGPSSKLAATKLALVGPNSVEDSPRLSALHLILHQFESPLILILVFAAAISLVLRQWVDTGIILTIVLGSSFLSFFQEYRASRAVEELKLRLALMCRVVRAIFSYSFRGKPWLGNTINWAARDPNCFARDDLHVRVANWQCGRQGKSLIVRRSNPHSRGKPQQERCRCRAYWVSLHKGFQLCQHGLHLFCNGGCSCRGGFCATVAHFFAFIVMSLRRDRVAARLFAPDAVWVAFASVLNGSILVLNFTGRLDAPRCHI